MNVETSIVIDRPIDEVFAYVTDPQYQAQYDDGIKDITYSPKGKVGVGTKINEVRTFLGRKIESTQEVVEYVPNSRYARSGQKPFPLTGTLTLDSVPGGTKLTWHWDGQPGGFFALAEGMVSSSFKKTTENVLSSIKEKLESGVPVHVG